MSFTASSSSPSNPPHSFSHLETSLFAINVDKITTGLQSITSGVTQFLEGQQTVVEQDLWRVGGFQTIAEFEECVCGNRSRQVQNFRQFSQWVWISFMNMLVYSSHNNVTYMSSHFSIRIRNGVLNF
jgi:hypothetical protein